ncbi:MAG: HIT domain-containing protein [Alphaproteobacteria bacterium]|nr:HIT domain-containing protein [Alphaproteobacteria bacterium]
MYDENNVFAKIIRGELPSKKIYENEYAMSFHNINPVAEIHALIIPKGPYKNIHDFLFNAPTEAIAGFWDAYRETANILGLSGDYNIAANTGSGPFFTQSIMHFHLHLLGGKRLKDEIEL